MIYYVMLLVCIFLIIIRAYLCYRIEYNIILVVLYPFTLMSFLLLSVATIMERQDRFEEKIIFVIMGIGTVLFFISFITSIINIYKQIKNMGFKIYVNNNIVYILILIGAIITVAPAVIVSLVIPFIDLAMLFKKNKGS